jgi:capsid protein
MEFSATTDFGGTYSGVESTTRRKAPRTVLRSEDDTARDSVRRRLVSTTRDLRRNFSVAKWAINKHLDFVVSHNFRARTGDEGLDRELERFYAWACHKERFDSRRKHSKRRFMRLLEASRTVDGDVFAHKIRTGRLQAIEGDRVRDPFIAKSQDDNWVHGILLDRYGAEKSYAIHRRRGQRFELERIISAKRIIPFGYYERFDQTRGISPLASAIREFRDVYDGLDYALAREKVNQLFTLAITRDSPDSFFDTDGDNVDSSQEPYVVNFGEGPQVLDLDPGDDAKFLTPQGTTQESQKLWETVLMIALKSLDIPFSFYKEDFTNYSGNRAALMLYLKSCKDKRADVVEFENEWFRWRLSEGITYGEIDVPFNPYEVRDAWQFIPDGVPWWDPSKEARANELSVRTYQRTRSEIRQELFGDDWFSMMEQRKKEDEHLERLGFEVQGPLDQPNQQQEDESPKNDDD